MTLADVTIVAGRESLATSVVPEGRPVQVVNTVMTYVFPICVHMGPDVWPVNGLPEASLRTPADVVCFSAKADKVEVNARDGVVIVGEVAFTRFPDPVKVFPATVAVPVVSNVAVIPVLIVRVPVLVVMVSPLIVVTVATPKAGVTKVGEVALTRFPDPVNVFPATVAVPVVSNVAVIPVLIVRVPVVEVIVNPFMVVAVATPRTGVTRVGDVALTKLPEPVKVFPATVAVPVVSNVATIPALIVRVPVVEVIVNPFTVVAVATPKVGVTRVGDVALTRFPDPVKVFPATVAVPVVSNVATIPALIVSVPVVDVMVNPFKVVAVATPSVGVTREGDVCRTITPVPVTEFPRVVTVPVVSNVATTPLFTVSVPVEVVMVRPFSDVAVATPNVGVVREGDVCRTITPVPVTEFPRVVTVPVVSNVATTPLFTVSVPVEVVMVSPFKVVAVATPRVGVINEGDVCKTMFPEPVTAFPRAVIVPVVAKVTVIPEVIENVAVPDRVMVNPLMEVAVATPNVGVTRVGEVASTMAPVPVTELPKTVTVPDVSAVIVIPLSMVNVPVLVVMVSPFKVVAVATPKTGVTRVGDVCFTRFPDPVNVFPAVVTVPVVSKVTVIPLLTVSVPVVEVMVSPLIEEAVAAPKEGVVSVGDTALTKLPVPVTVFPCTVAVPVVSTVTVGDPDPTKVIPFTEAGVIVAPLAKAMDPLPETGCARAEDTPVPNDEGRFRKVGELATKLMGIPPIFFRNV
jgi:hypothetical protein